MLILHGEKNQTFHLLQKNPANNSFETVALYKWKEKHKSSFQGFKDYAILNKIPFDICLLISKLKKTTPPTIFENLFTQIFETHIQQEVV